MQNSTPHWRTIAIRILWTLVFFLPMLLLIGVTQSLKEYFPFSHFPMYDKMGSTSYYVFVTDGDGNPLPAVPVTGERTTKIKRVYDTELRRIKKQLHQQGTDKLLSELTQQERLPAGIHTLEWLRGLATPQSTHGARFHEHKALRLYQATINMKDGKLIQPPPVLVGEIDLSATE